MTDIEPRPIDPGLESAHRRELTSSDLIQRVARDLSPTQSYLAARHISRRRLQTAVALARVEDESIETDARAIARAKGRRTEEQVERLLHSERLDCLAQAVLKHEETARLIDLVQDETAHTLFKEALKAVSTRYTGGISRRSGS